MSTCVQMLPVISQRLPPFAEITTDPSLLCGFIVLLECVRLPTLAGTSYGIWKICNYNRSCPACTEHYHLCRRSGQTCDVDIHNISVIRHQRQRCGYTVGDDENFSRRGHLSVTLERPVSGVRILLRTICKIFSTGRINKLNIMCFIVHFFGELWADICCSVSHLRHCRPDKGKIRDGFYYTTSVCWLWPRPGAWFNRLDAWRTFARLHPSYCYKSALCWCFCYHSINITCESDPLKDW